MQLADWLRQQGMTLTAFGQLIARPTETVRRYAAGMRIPEPEAIELIRVATGEAVTANDFHAKWREVNDRPSSKAAPAQDTADEPVRAA